MKSDFLLRRDFLPAAVLVGLGLAAYAVTVSYPFVHDDIPLVVDNPVLKHWDWKAAFLRETDFGGGADLSRPYYRPVLDAIHRAVFAIFGPRPAAFHGLNVVLHIVNGWLIFRIAGMVLERFGIQRTSAYPAALAAAALFIIHPVQTQAVACVSGISNLAFVFFCLLSFLFFLNSTSCSGFRRRLWIFAMSAMFIPALLCKEQALMFPGLVVWYQWCALSSRPDGKKRLPEIFKLSALFAVLIVFYVLWKNIFVGVPTFAIDSTAGGMTRIFAIPHILLTNVRILFFPDDLHYFRSLDLLADHMRPALIFAGLSITVIYLSGFLRTESRRAVIWGLGWFVIAQIPTMQIVPLFWEYSRMSLAEHFLYFPSIGMFLAVSVAVGDAAGRASRQTRILIVAVCAAMSAILLTVTIHQNRYWASETVLFERAIRYEPHLGRLQRILAQVYFHGRKYPESIAADRKAIGIMERYEMVAVGNEAKTYYRKIRADAMMSLGLSYRAMNDLPSAIEWMRRAVEIDPDNAGNHSALGVVYAEQGAFEPAHRHLSRAIELAPEHADYLRNFGLLLSMQGRVDEARTYFMKVLEIHPSDPTASDFLEGRRK